MFLLVADCLTVLPCLLDQSTRDFQHNYSRICTITVYISRSVMASGDDHRGQPAGDRNEVTFQCEIRTSWNHPKTYVDLNSPDVVVLDTTVDPDVLGLHAFNEEAALVGSCPVLPRT